MYMVALAFARPEWQLPGIGALAFAWLTSYAGLLGAVVGKPTQSVGPVGQTDRLAVLQLFSLLAFLSDRFGWGIDFSRVCLFWVIAGGCLTVALRLYRHFRNVTP
jgi:CDP-diacylglycerol--glycerol-3-phosphate 3-phosphatidyltransferase